MQLASRDSSEFVGFFFFLWDHKHLFNWTIASVFNLLSVSDLFWSAHVANHVWFGCVGSEGEG